jgi:adenosylcobinamide-phosphate synthase
MLDHLQHGFLLAAAALLIENLIGYPKSLQATIGHPVEWFGSLLTKLEITLNQPVSTNRANGTIAIGLAIAAAATAGFVLQWAFLHVPYGDIAIVAIATTLIAQKSLRDHVSAVRDASSIESARVEIAKIVGRDPQSLDESGISKAALESLAENTSDGIVAPALWYAIAGLPGIFVYKMINTADSMIGHKTERYLHFGWAAARIDDLMNLPASRLTGLMFAAATLSRSQAKKSFNAMMRDASKHRSPNAGWPEAAMAGALDLRFGGPREYDGETEDLPWMGAGRDDKTRADITKGLALYDKAIVLLAAVFFGLAIVL